MPDIQNIPTTQYIGPRIIPHLWDPILWDASTQYDALAVVQYEGAGYVARYVPPQGTVPTNTEYWVRWSDFNAQLAQLQQTVQTFDNRITANADAITTENRARTEADTALQEDIDANSTALTTETSARTAADDSLQAAIDLINDALAAQDYATAQQKLLVGNANNYNPNGLILPMETFIDHNDQLYYGTVDTQSSWVSMVYDELTDSVRPRDVQGVNDGGTIKFPGSCSTLVLSGLLGVSYENSRYGNGSASVSTSGSTAYLTGGSNVPFGASQFLSEKTQAIASIKYGSGLGNLHSWQMAEYFNAIGLLHELEDLRQLRPGDILFYANWTGEVKHWGNINHCEVLCGINAHGTEPGLMVVEGQSRNPGYAAFTNRSISSTLVADQLKWFARIPSSGAPCVDMVADFEPITISAAGWTNVPFANKLELAKNRAFSVIMELENWEASRNDVHFNVGLFEDITLSKPVSGVYAGIFLNSTMWQVAPNTFAAVGHTGEDYGGKRARIQTIGTPSSPIVIKRLQVFNGVVSV